MVRILKPSNGGSDWTARRECVCQVLEVFGWRLRDVDVVAGSSRKLSFDRLFFHEGLSLSATGNLHMAPTQQTHYLH